MSSRFVVSAALVLVSCGPSRIETDPSTVELHARGQQATIHAVGLASSGRAMPDRVCTWSSSDGRVAQVAGPHNVAKVTAVGHGRAVARCRMGSATAEVPVTVMLVSRVELAPRAFDLRVLDEPVATRVEVRAFDPEGRELRGRIAMTSCDDENVCRGDARGQVWPVAAGETRLVVRVDDGEATAPVRVVDARSAAARPRAVKGNPMEHIGDAADVPRRKR